MARIIVRLTLGVLPPCTLLVLAACIFAIWQPSTEIAFICQRKGISVGQVCLTDADRGAVVSLTSAYEVSAYSVDWSPDGSQLVFDGTVGSSAYGVYLLSARGGQPRLLMLNGHDPDWSPEGTQIVFTQAKDRNNYWAGWGIYSTALDGTAARPILGSSAIFRNPVWSPDGTRIAFQSRTATSSNTAIFTVRPDGTDLRRVTEVDTGAYHDPAWSPDGTHLALFFSADWKRDILLLDLQDGEQRDLTAEFSNEAGGYEGSPSWSPDGKRIAFDSDASRGYWQPRGWWVYVMRADGSGVYVVAYGQRPAWRPPRVFSWDDLWS